MTCGPEENAGRVRKRGGDAAELEAQLPKCRDLLGIECVLRRIGAGEVAHDQRDAMVRHFRARRERRCFRDGETEPVHAGIEMKCRAAPPTACHAERVPLQILHDAVDHRAGVDLGVSPGGARHDAVEHVDRRALRHDRPDAACLGEMGDEKGGAAGLGEMRGHRFDAAAIGVGLDHGGAVGRDHALRQRLPVLGDGGKIDRQYAAGFEFMRAGTLDRSRRLTAERRRRVRRRCGMRRDLRLSFGGIDWGFRLADGQSGPLTMSGNAP